MNKLIGTIKEIHKKDVYMIKTGTFYHAYNRDAYILSYLFGYKIKEIESQTKECGFPLSALPKVKAKLENSKINYLTLDRRNNYDVDEQENYKNLNNYDRYYEKAHKYINSQRRIDRISNFLQENINEDDFLEIVKEMEEIINERRKI